MATMKTSANKGATKSASTTTKSASSGASDFESKFKKVQEDNPQGQYKSLPLGKWEATASAAGTMDKDGNFLGFIDYTADEGEAEGQTGRAFFAIENDEGDIQLGAAIMHRQLADMGYIDREESFHSKDHIEEVLAQVESNPCKVIIKVAMKKGFTNIYLDSVVEPVEV